MLTFDRFPNSLGDYSFLIGGILLIAGLIFSKLGKNKAKNIVIVLFILNFIAPMLFPRQVFGKWDAIQQLKGKEITTILLKPSEPGWEVNLTDSCFIITNKNQIDTIVNLLRHCDVFIANHPARKWETEMVLVTGDQETLSLQIQMTDNNGTDIYGPAGEFRQDVLKGVLESITKYSTPFKGSAADNCHE